MGRQVRFWMLPEDEDEFCGFVRQEAGVLLGSRSGEPNPAVIPGGLPAATKTIEPYGRASQLWIAHKADLSSLTWRFVEDLNVWFVDRLDSPVVEFSRSYIRGQDLVDGRIWAEMTALVEPQEGASYIKPKSAEFVTFYEATAKWLRRRYKRGPEAGWYVGPAALRWQQQGGKLTFSTP